MLGAFHVFRLVRRLVYVTIHVVACLRRRNLKIPSALFGLRFVAYGVSYCQKPVFGQYTAYERDDSSPLSVS